MTLNINKTYIIRKIQPDRQTYRRNRNEKNILNQTGKAYISSIKRILKI